MTDLYLYFIGAGERGPVKIGVAANPAVRMAQLQVGNPETLVLLAAMSILDAAFEKRLHAYLAPLRSRTRGEWFMPHVALYQMILDLTGSDLGARMRRLLKVGAGTIDLMPPDDSDPGPHEGRVDPSTLTKDERIEMLARNPHGTTGCYDLIGCTCDACKQAKRDYNRAKATA